MAAKPDEFQPHPVNDQLPGVEFCVSSSPNWGQTMVLGFQHYLVMLGTTVIIPTTLVPIMGGGDEEKAEVINTLLFVTGINTLLQTWFGTRLPVVMGGSYAFNIASLSIAYASGRSNIYTDSRERFIVSMQTMQGGLIMASLFNLLIGFFGFGTIFGRYLNPLAAVPLVTLTGLGLYAHAFPQLAKCIEVGLPALVILVLVSQYLPNLVKSKRAIFDKFAVVFTVGIVWAYAEVLTLSKVYEDRPWSTQTSCRTDRAGIISGASWIMAPFPFQWGRPLFNPGDAFAMMAASFVAITESTGTFIAATRYGSATPMPPSVLSRGIGWQGVGLLLNGLFGTGTGCTASVENAGLLGLTRNGSRRVIQISAGFMIFFSFLGKFGAILASIPLPIVAALHCVLFAYVASAGLGFLQFCNLNSFRTKFILGFSLFTGLSVTRYFNDYLLMSGHGPVNTASNSFNNIMQVIFSSPATVAIVVAYFLDCSHSLGDSGTRQDCGKHWWEKFRCFSRDARTSDFYSLPCRLGRFFPSS